MKLKTLRAAMAAKVNDPANPNRETEAMIVKAIDQRYRDGADPEADLDDLVDFTLEDGRSTRVEQFVVPAAMASFAQQLAEFLGRRQSFVTAEIPPKLRPDHEARFLVLRGGRPFACIRRDPRLAMLAPDWPEGEYTVNSFCTCCKESSESKPFARMTSFGDGIGTLRTPDGKCWSTDMPL